MTPRTFYAVCLCVLSRLASGTLAPRRHAVLYLAGWLAARTLNHSHFIVGKAD